MLTMLGCATTPPAPASYTARQSTTGRRTQRIPFVAPRSYAAFVRAELAANQGGDGPQQAVRYYERALADGPYDPYLRCRYAQALHKAGDPEAAAEVLRDTLKEVPNHPLPWLTYGAIAEAAHDLDEALYAYGRAATLIPPDPAGAVAMARLLRAEHNASAAQQVLIRLALQQPEQRPLALRARLDLALATGRADEAATIYGKLHQVPPTSASTLQEVAAALLKHGQTTPATHLLRKIPTAANNAPLKLQAYEKTFAWEPLKTELTQHPADWFGGPGVVAEALLRIAEPAAALLAIEEAQLLLQPNAKALHRQTLCHMQARAQLQQQDALAALATLEGGPAGALEHPAGRALLRQILGQLGQPQLGQLLSSEP